MHVKWKYENIERTKNIPMILLSLFSDEVSNLNWNDLIVAVAFHRCLLMVPDKSLISMLMMVFKAKNLKYQAVYKFFLALSPEKPLFFMFSGGNEGTISKKWVKVNTSWTDTAHKSRYILRCCKLTWRNIWNSHRRCSIKRSCS